MTHDASECHSNINVRHNFSCQKPSSCNMDNIKSFRLSIKIWIAKDKSSLGIEVAHKQCQCWTLGLTKTRSKRSSSVSIVSRVSRELQESFKGASREFHVSFIEFHMSFIRVSRDFHEIFKGASREFQEYFKIALRELERFFRNF